MPFRPAHEIRLFQSALQMLTRLPIAIGAPQADWLARSAKYFPLVGLLVGGLSAAAFVLASQLWPAPIPALVAVAAGLFATGALHEDGLADCADALGVRDRDRKLAVMKDPRLGAFGALALGLLLAGKVAALSAMPIWLAATSLIAAAALSRFWAAAVMARSTYAGDRVLAKVDHGIEGPTSRELAVALAIAFASLLLLDLPQALAALLASTLAATLVAVTLCRGLGGYTGDVLGAVVAVSETAFLLGAAARLPWL